MPVLKTLKSYNPVITSSLSITSSNSLHLDANGSLLVSKQAPLDGGSEVVTNWWSLAAPCSISVFSFLLQSILSHPSLQPHKFGHCAWQKSLGWKTRHSCRMHIDVNGELEVEWKGGFETKGVNRATNFELTDYWDRGSWVEQNCGQCASCRMLYICSFVSMSFCLGDVAHAFKIFEVLLFIGCALFGCHTTRRSSWEGDLSNVQTDQAKGAFNGSNKRCYQCWHWFSIPFGADSATMLQPARTCACNAWVGLETKKTCERFYDKVVDDCNSAILVERVKQDIKDWEFKEDIYIYQDCHPSVIFPCMILQIWSTSHNNCKPAWGCTRDYIMFSKQGVTNAW